MTILVTVVVAGLVLGGSAVAWRSGGPADRPLDPATPVRLLVIVYLLLYGAGSIALAATGEATTGPLAVGGAFVALGAGVWASRRWLGPVAAVPAGATIGTIRTPLLLGMAVIGLAGFTWLAIDHGIPLLSSDPLASRGGYSGIRLDAFRWLVPPAALVALGLALAEPSRRRWAVAIAALGGVVALEVLAASRALPFELGVAALLIVLWAGRRLSWRQWLALGLAGLVLFVGVLFARLGDRNTFGGPLDAISFAVNRTVGRVLLIHPRTIEVVVETFPGEEPFLLGGTYVRWLGPLTGSDRRPSLGAMLFERLFPDEPPGGFAAPGLLGEAWANGGPILAGIVMLALGVAASAAGRLAAGLSDGAVDRAFAALLAVALARTYATSLNGFLLTVTAAVAWWYLAGGRMPRRFTFRTRSSEPAGDPRSA